MFLVRAAARGRTPLNWIYTRAFSSINRGDAYSGSTKNSPVSRPQLRDFDQVQSRSRTLPEPCLDFLKGKCTRGDRCKFSHAPISGSKQQKSIPSRVEYARQTRNLSEIRSERNVQPSPQEISAQLPPFSTTNPFGSNPLKLPDPALLSTPPEKKRERGGERDWTCSACQHQNFARRTECQRCQTPRIKQPEGGRKSWLERVATPRQLQRLRQNDLPADWVPPAFLEFKHMPPGEALIALSHRLKSCVTRRKLTVARATWKYMLERGDITPDLKACRPDG